jgi:hypothetical protein
MEDFRTALNQTRVLRLALNTLWDGLPEEVIGAAGHPVADVFAGIHAYLSNVEQDILTRHGFAEYFTVIKPVSPACPPPPQAMEKITAAIRVLAEHDLLDKQADAMLR